MCDLEDMSHCLSKDMFLKVVSKFYAVMRYQLYHKIKNYLNNDEELGTLEDSEETKKVISDRQMLKLAEEIEINELYKQVFNLLNIPIIDHKCYIDLQLKQCEYMYLVKEPNDKQFVSYMNCLAEAHN
jgi:hypothetical protein